MSGYSAKEKLSALLVAGSVIATPIVNYLPMGISGSAEEDKPVNNGSVNTPDNPDTIDLPSLEGACKVVDVSKTGAYRLVTSDVGDIAYVKYQSKVSLSAEGSNWDILNSIDVVKKADSVQGTSAKVVGTFTKDSIIVDILESGEYFLTIHSEDGDRTESIGLSELIGFSKVDCDMSGISIDSVYVDSQEVGNNSWVSKDKFGNLYFDISTQNNVATVRVNLNGSNHYYYADTGNIPDSEQPDGYIDLSHDSTYLVKADLIKSLIDAKESSLVFEFYVVNNHGSTDTKRVSVKVSDLETVSIDNEKVLTKEGTEYTPYIDSTSGDMYIKKNSKVSFDIDGGWYGVKKVKLYRDGDTDNVIAEYNEDKVVFSNNFNISDRYYIIVEYNNGYVADKGAYLFGGRKVNFDEEAPKITNVNYGSDTYEEGKWYNSRRKLSLTVEENLALDLVEPISVTVNGTDCLSNVISTNNGNKHIFNINLSNLERVSDGKYKFVFSFKDVLGNTVKKELTVLVDTVKPVYTDNDNNSLVKFSDEGIIVTDDNNLVLVSGELGIKPESSFVDILSGIGSVVYYTNNSNKVYDTPVERFSSYFSGGILNIDSVNSEDKTSTGDLKVDLDGVFVVTDIAGNVSEFTVKDMLKNYKGVDVGTVEEDNSEPVIVEKSVSGKKKNGYFTSFPSYIFEITDDHLESVIISDNGIKKEYAISQSNEYTVDILEDGAHSIVVTAKDKAGHTSEYTTVANVDTSKPVVDVDISGKPVIKYNDKHYFSSALNLKVKSSDTSGIKSYKLVKDGAVVETNVNGVFIINTDGEYSIQIENGAGWVTVVKLADVLELDTPVIAFDLQNPEVNGSIVSTTTYEDWYSDNVDIKFSVSDNVGLQGLAVTVNGKSTTYDDKTVVISTKNYEADKDGYYTVSAVATDMVGRKSKVWSTKVRIDFDNPEFGSVDVETPIQYGDTLYFGNTPVTVKISGSDRSSGIKGYYLRNTLTGESIFSVSGEFDILVGGEYDVTIEDLVGHKVTKTLGDLAGWGTNRIAFDTSGPIVSGKRDSLSDYYNWYNQDQTFSISAKDDMGIKSLVVTINGEEVKKIVNAGEIVTEYNISVGTEGINPTGNGVYVIEAKVTDIMNTTESWSDMIYIDKEAPAVKANVPKVVIDSGNAYYDGESFDLSVDASDIGSGIKEYRLVCDEKGTVANKTGLFRIDSNGQYFIEVEDNTGLVSRMSLGELGNWGTNSLVFDRESPFISGVRSSSSSYENDWYDEDVIFDLTASDDICLKSFTADVNGTKFVCDNLTRPELSISTFGIETDSRGRYNIVAVAEDVVGNKFTWSDTVYVDKESPSISLVNASKVVKVIKGTAFFNTSSIDVSFVASDSGSGIKEYRLLRGSNVVSVNKDGKFSINTNGEYYIAAVDNVGRVTTMKLNDLTKWGSNKIAFDYVSPNITGSRSKLSVYKDWYSSDVEFDISASDNQGIDSIDIYINDKLVEAFEANNVVKTNKFRVSTKGVEPDDSGAYSVRAVVKDVVGLYSEWTDMIHIDTSNPEIEGFVLGGSVLTSQGKYKYVFDGNGSVKVNAVDKSPSCGIKYIYVKTDGDWVKYPTNGSSSVYVDLPKNYKGNVSAYVVDNLDRKSSEVLSDGIISEDSNTAITHSSIKIDMGSSNKYDGNNIPIFNGNVNAVVNVKCDWSGISSLEWGVGDNSLGSTTDFSKATRWDGNIPIEFSLSSILSDEGRAQEFWVKVVDNAGYTSSDRKLFTIDRTTPTINVSYNTSNSNGYYSTSRTAVVTVTDDNIDINGVVISGNIGSRTNWVRNGNGYSSTLSFVDDGEYNFSISAVDMSGNTASSYSSGNFIIDKTNPVVSVSWESNDDKDFYNDSRVATVTVTDTNFDPSNVEIKGGKLGQWSHNGTTHSIGVVFDSSGSLYVNGKDLAGNSFVSSYDSGFFVIDKVAPTVNVLGVSDGVSYKDNVEFFVDVEDAYLDTDSVDVSLTGKVHNEIKLKGTKTQKGISFSYNNFPRTADVDDRYTISIYAKDKAGNVVTKKVEFSVNRFGSSFNSDTGNNGGSDKDNRGTGRDNNGGFSTNNGGATTTDNSRRTTNGTTTNRVTNATSNGNSDSDSTGNYHREAPTVKVTEVNVDKIDTDKVKIVVTKDGKEIDVPKNLVTITQTEKDGKMVVEYEIDESLFVEDGKYTVQIYSMTEDGTTYSSVAEEYSFVKDSTPPEIIISGIEDSGVYETDKKRVSIDIRDLSGVESLEVLLNGSPIEYINEDGLYLIDIPEADGTQNLSVKAVDKAGNESVIVIRRFTISSKTMSPENNGLVKKLMIGFGIAVFALLGIILGHRYKVRRGERNIVYDNEKYYSGNKVTGSTPTHSSSSGDSYDDVLNESTDAVTEVMSDEESSTSMFMSDSEDYKSRTKGKSSSVDSSSGSELQTSSTGIGTDIMGSSELQTGLMGSTELRTDLMGSSELKTDMMSETEMQTGLMGATELQTDVMDEG